MKQTELKKITVCFFFTIFFVACGTVYDQGYISNNGNNEVVFAQWSFLHSLDPHIPNDTISREALTQIYETLTFFDKNGNLVPWLAESFYHITPTKWLFNLRSGITFHDGEPFNAEAVRVNFNRLLDPSSTFPIAWMLQMISEVEVIDDYTLYIHTYFPFAPLAAHLSTSAAMIISPTAILTQETGGVTVSDNPIGTGPFKVIEINHGQDLRMQAFNNYWYNLPNFTYLTFLSVPESSTRLNMLETGEVNAIIASSLDASEIEASPNMELLRVYSTRFNFALVNNSQPPFNNRYIRRAMTMVLDLDAVMEAIDHMGVKALGPVPTTVIGHSPNLVRLERDLYTARDYLQRAGMPNGFSTTIYIGAGRPLDERLVAQIWQHNLSEIGINASIVELEWGTFLYRLDTGDLNAFITGWTGFTGEADNILFASFHSSMHGIGGNLSFFDDPITDDLLMQARNEMNENLRHEIYRQVSQRIIDEAPLMSTFYPVFPFGINGLDNLHISSGAMPHFRTATLSLGE